MSGAAPGPGLAAALAHLTSRFPPERIDKVWIFPPRPLGQAESALAVLSLYPLDDSPGRREVVTLHCVWETIRGRLQRTDTLVEQGSAPAERLSRVIDGVLGRMKNEREVPRSERIDGDRVRWGALLGLPAPVA